MTLAKKLDQLEQILHSLESDDVDLESAMESYKTALDIAKSCSEALKKTEATYTELRLEATTIINDERPVDTLF